MKWFLVLLFSLCQFTNAEPGVAVDVKLSPAGAFAAQTKKVTGYAVKTADGVSAENIVVDAKSLQTGISLRDKHLKDRLEVEKYPNIKLLKAIGKEGKGEGTMEIKGQTMKVSGEYKEEGGMLLASFKVHLPELKLERIKYMGVGVKDDVLVKVTVPLRSK